MLYSRTFLFIHSVYSSLHLPIPNPQSLPLPHPPPRQPQVCSLPMSVSLFLLHHFSSVQSCLIFHDPVDCSTPGFPVHHYLPEPTQTHVHRVSDASQPSHPLSSPSPPALNLSQHQGLFQCISSLHQVAKLLELQFQHQSFQ